VARLTRYPVPRALFRQRRHVQIFLPATSVPAVLLTNNAEGVTPSGTVPTVGNSGGVSGNAWDSVSVIGAGSNLTSDSAQTAHGGLAYKYVYATAGGANLDAQWSTSMGTQSQVWFRLYLKFTANPTGANLGVWSCAPAAGTCGRLFVNTTGKLQFNDSAGSAVLTSTNTIPLNQWFRVEGFLTGSATVGQEEFKLFSGMDDVIPLETQTSAATVNTSSASITKYDFGMPGTAVTQTITYWMDDVGVSNTAYLGPVGTPAAPPVPLVAPSLAALQASNF
jgi:hypothetical protein